ncbi:hypothetical protein E2562_020983 [Oryza meyeriana var. granulata]|uniref:Uncharacterized protein n=1 Tax=Oryza meyeriana var. granulata TaxID=110450 RepID=A0A6G1DZR5_9ORYZ|nr:hypothetical protein E2562_020983 [Oryza meyeriana var. granulata]
MRTTSPPHLPAHDRRRPQLSRALTARFEDKQGKACTYLELRWSAPRSSGDELAQPSFTKERTELAKARGGRRWRRDLCLLSLTPGY